MTVRTDLLLRLDCPDCGGLLAFSSSSAQKEFVFACPQGHTATLASLRARQAEEVRSGLNRVLEGWQEKSELLEKIAAQARERGYQQIAQNLQAEQAKLRERAGQVERGLRDENPRPPNPP